MIPQDEIQTLRARLETLSAAIENADMRLCARCGEVLVEVPGIWCDACRPSGAVCPRPRPARDSAASYTPGEIATGLRLQGEQEAEIDRPAIARLCEVAAEALERLEGENAAMRELFVKWLAARFTPGWTAWDVVVREEMAAAAGVTLDQASDFARECHRLWPNGAAEVRGYPSRGIGPNPYLEAERQIRNEEESRELAKAGERRVAGGARS